MEIKVKEIRKELNNLKRFIENYELTNLNIHNEIKNASFNWNDGNATNFFEDVEKNKIKILTMIDEFKITYEIYEKITNKYEVLGENIKFNLDVKNNVYNKIEEQLKKIDSIIKDYENLELSFCNQLSDSINNQLTIMKDTKIKLETYKKKLKATIIYIEDTEKEINFKIYNINNKIEEIKEQKVEDFY